MKEHHLITLYVNTFAYNSKIELWQTATKNITYVVAKYICDQKEVTDFKLFHSSIRAKAQE